MTTTRHDLAGRFFGAPLALERNAALGLPSALHNLMASADPCENNLSLVEGVAVIHCRGLLTKGETGLQAFVSYEWLRQCFLVAFGDPGVRAICLDFDSLGGEVAGLFDLADTIYKARGRKPVWAVLSEHATAGAYALASACDRVTVPRTGTTGGVGVLVAHMSFAGMLDQDGVSVSLISYGDRKGDGNEFSPLSPTARASMQRDVDAIGELFVKTVARNRGLPAAKVRATHGAIFMGSHGVEAGFADACMAPDAAFADLVALVAPKRKRA